MASRYDTTGVPQYTGSFSQSASAGQSTSTGTTSERSSSSSSQRTSYNIDTMSGSGRSALSQLIAQLSAGGTEEQRRNQKLVLDQINNLEALSQQYSRQNAFADAEGLLSQTLRRAMEEAMPSILQAQAAAGTSGDALSALLSQDAATRASEAASAQGLGAAIDYGQILASLQGQKTNLVGTAENTVTDALLSALGLDAGSMKRGSESTRSSSSSSRSATSTTSTQESGKGSEKKFIAQSDNPQSVLDFQRLIG